MGWVVIEAKDHAIDRNDAIERDSQLTMSVASMLVIAARVIAARDLMRTILVVRIQIGIPIEFKLKAVEAQEVAGFESLDPMNAATV